MLARQTTSERPLHHPIIWGQNEAGENVTEWSALKYAVVFSCVRLIAETIGNLPWQVLRERPGGGADRVTNHVSKLLQRKTNPEMASGIFRETMMSHALTWGNGYAEIERDRANRPHAMWLIHPSMVTVERNAAGEIVYIIKQTNGTQRVLPQADVFHLRGLGRDGLVGYSPLEIAMRAIGIGIAEDKFSGAFFGNGQWPGGLLKFPGKLTPEQRKEFRESLSGQNQGAGKARRIQILEQGLEWETLSIPNDHAQLLESRRFQIIDICRVFRVPPHKVFDLQRATFNNITEQNIEFVQDQQPWMHRLEQEADIKLLSDRSGSDLFTKINTNALLRGDPVRRAKFYETLQRIGVASINEIRDWEDLNPITNGDTHFVLSNLMTLEKAVKEPEPVPPAFGGPPEPGDDEPEDDATPDVMPEADLAVQDFLSHVVTKQLRKEHYGVRAMLKAANGDQDAWIQRVGEFVLRHQADTMVHLVGPIRAWLRLHASDIDSEVLADELAALHADRLSSLLGGKHDADGFDALLLEQEGTRAESLCTLITGRLKNAINTD